VNPKLKFGWLLQPFLNPSSVLAQGRIKGARIVGPHERDKIVLCTNQLYIK